MRNESIITSVLLAAGIYHLCFALWIVVDPDAFLALIHVPPSSDLDGLVGRFQLPTVLMALFFLISFKAKSGRFEALYVGILIEILVLLTMLLVMTFGTSRIRFAATNYFLFSLINGAVWCYPKLKALATQVEPSSSSLVSQMKAILRRAFESPSLSALSSVAISEIIGIFLCLLSVHTFTKYGFVLFVIVPLSMGLFAALLHALAGYRSLGQCILVSQFSIGIACFCLLVIAAEGVICIVMAIPLLSIAGILGAGLGYLIQNRFFSKSGPFLASIVLLNPLLFQFEAIEPNSNRETVTTKIVVRAEAARIWQVLQRPIRLEQQTRLLEQVGFSVPRAATVVNQVGQAVLRCDFKIGSLNFPIERLVPNRELTFRPMDQTPTPMKELSIYEDIDAPHLHGYFSVESGTIFLTPLGDGTTLLEARTQFTHKIAPSVYWNKWTGFIIDRLHLAVLSAIQQDSEKSDF